MGCTVYVLDQHVHVFQNQCLPTWNVYMCRQIYYTRRTKYQHLNVPRLVLKWPWRNLLKRMKIQFEQRRQAMLQLHLRDEQVYYLLRCALYQVFDGNTWKVPLSIDSFIISITYAAYLQSDIIHMDGLTGLCLKGGRSNEQYCIVTINEVHWHVVMSGISTN